MLKENVVRIFKNAMLYKFSASLCRRMNEHNKEIYWKQQADIFAKIEGGVGKYALGLPNLSNAFELADRYVRCIDGRTPGGIHLAGAGCLLPDDKTVQILKKAKPTGIYSHDDCGAAKLASADAEQHAKHIAAKLGVDFIGHLLVNGPHIEHVVYVDGTGNFDWCRVPDLPPGFSVSWRYTFPVDPAYAKREVEISIGIARGTHGMLFGIEEPFIIVPIGVPREDPDYNNFSLVAIKEQLNEICSGFGGSVKIDKGFTAPMRKE